MSQQKNTKPKPKAEMFKVEPWSNGTPDDQTIDDGYVIYDIPSVIFQARDLIPFDLPLIGMRVDYKISEDGRIIDFVSHMKSILEADLSRPIILDREGWVIDGRHRIAKALYLNHQTIKAVRFQQNPHYKCLSRETEQ